MELPSLSDIRSKDFASKGYARFTPDSTTPPDSTEDEYDEEENDEEEDDEEEEEEKADHKQQANEDLKVPQRKKAYKDSHSANAPTSSGPNTPRRLGMTFPDRSAKKQTEERSPSKRAQPKVKTLQENDHQELGSATGNDTYTSSTAKSGQLKGMEVDGSLQEETKSPQEQQEQPSILLLKFASETGIKMPRSISLLTTEQESDEQFQKRFSDLYIKNHSNIGDGDLDVLNKANVSGGCCITFTMGKKASLRLADGIETADSPDSPNPIYKIKVRGTNMSKVLDVAKPIIPDQYVGQVKRNMKFLVEKKSQNVYGWSKYKLGFLNVFCPKEHVEGFVKALNDLLSDMHSKKDTSQCSLPPCPQIEQLPSKTTSMVWVQIPIPLLNMIGLRSYTWSDLTVFIVNHVEDVLLVGKISVAGKDKATNKDSNAWDLAIQYPPYDGESIYPHTPEQE